MRVKHLLKQVFYPKIGLISLCLLLSCSQTRPQYQPEAPESVDTSHRLLSESQLKSHSPPQQASNPQGGLLWNQKAPDQNALQESQQIRENFLHPIDMRKLSVASIDRDSTYSEAQEILNSLDQNGNIIHYKEGIVIQWKAAETLPTGQKPTPLVINISQYYRGPLNFEGNIQEKRIGDSLRDQFDLSASSLREDKKAIAFINSLFKNWINEKEAQCVQNKKCSIEMTEDNRIEFDLPERKLFFSNDDRRNLLAVVMIPETEYKKPSCLSAPFDLSKHRLICSGDETGPEEFIQLGESYKDIKYKTIGYGLNTREAFPRNIPLEYHTENISQKTVDTILHWTKPNTEERPDQLLEDSLLYSLRLLPFEERIFLMDHSLIQFRLNSDDSFTFSKQALPQAWSPQLSLQSIRRRIEDSSPPNPNPEQDTFYLYNKIPPAIAKKMEDNRDFQLQFIQTFFEFFVQEELKNDPSLKTYQYNKELENDILYVNLILLPSQGPQKVLTFLLSKNEKLGIIVTLFSNPDSFLNWDTYIAQNINHSTVDFNSPSTREQNLNERSFSGFQLGGKIYVKNKDLATQTAFAFFESQGTLFRGAVSYFEQREIKRAYPNRDSISYEKADRVTINSIYIYSNIQLYVQTTGARDSSGEFEEYEIIGIKKRGEVQALNLCNIEGLNAEIGISQKEFSARLIEQISPLKDRDSQAICPFILSKDRLRYIFPNSQTILQFERIDEKALASIQIYKLPSYQAEDLNRTRQ